MTVPARQIRAGYTDDTVTVYQAYRSLHVGLSGEAVRRYVDERVVGLTDVTGPAQRIRELLDAGDERAAADPVPGERPYPLPAQVSAAIGATPA